MPGDLPGLDGWTAGFGATVAGMDFQHVDVFADAPFTGNSVTVFLSDGTLATSQMLAITQEFRHFESIFLRPAADGPRWQARVFDLTEELDFAGHPVLGRQRFCTTTSAGTRRAVLNQPFTLHQGRFGCRSEDAARSRRRESGDCP